MHWPLKEEKRFERGAPPLSHLHPPSLIKGRGARGIGHQIKIQSERLLNNLPAQTIDISIFIMLDYSIMKLMCTEMFVPFQSAERKAFVFTVRTEVRLGGCCTHI